MSFFCRSLRLRNCPHLTDSSLSALVSVLGGRLEDLEVSYNGSITNVGLASLEGMGEKLQLLRQA